jgi:spore coat protein U-like protein
MTSPLRRSAHRGRKTAGRALQHALTAVIAAACLALAAQPALAASCTFQSVVGVAFGTYNVFSPNANYNGVGRLTIACSGGGSSSFVVALTTGQGNTHATRVMKSGANTLNYDLFTDAARTITWGDGTGGTSTIRIARNSTSTLSIYGGIPAGQDVAAGVYTDSIIATVTF